MPRAGAGEGASGRDTAIDSLRGLCIVAMVVAHLAKGSWLDQAAHPLPGVDGASGFFLLSGLLVGLVQRATIERHGESAGRRKLLRRVGLLYLAHLAISGLALTVVAFDSTRAAELPSVAGEGGWALALLRAVTLQINPAYVSVLSVYVVVMLAVLPLLWALHRGRWALGAGYAVIVYGIGIASPGLTEMAQRGGDRGGWSYGAWFGVFAVGATIGWSWRRPGVQSAVRSRRALVIGTAAMAVGTVVAVLMTSTGIAVRVIEKETFGPGRILLALAVFFVLWRAVTAVQRVPAVRTAIRPLTDVGQFSLDSYLILSIAVLVVPSLGDHDQSSATGVLVAVLVLACCVGWARGRIWLKSRSGASATVVAGRADHL
ncbi:OpgC domain-containing protein [Modestobacter sp. VKM Ac-2977]|uniref:OpgC domain-containing protein n=1 Tax=Modestobacter sp. VKM Ac-2977 TaxID=3004131 RepID=UPI0022AAE442|nr:OpgC domain-containing protein [Modestobacter sp. VKM Ac-2977]MCZ2822762.1 OpgC domain-containing protein [Modestobacter sp. VKM Ac-2977]